MFTESFVYFLLVTSLVWTGLGAVLLIALLVKDLIRGQAW